MRAIVKIVAAFAISSFSLSTGWSAGPKLQSGAGVSSPSHKSNAAGALEKAPRDNRNAAAGKDQSSPVVSDANGAPPRAILVAEEKAAAKVLATALTMAAQAGVDRAQLKAFGDQQEALRVQAASPDSNSLANVIAQTLGETNQVLQSIGAKLPPAQKPVEPSYDPPLSIVAMSFAIALFVSAVGVLMAAIAARRRTERVLGELGLL